MGSIVENAADLPIDTTLTFFLFKVVIGRAYCHRDQEPPKNCPEGYDSVYMQELGQDSKNIFSHNYYIYNYERVQLIHQIVTKIKVDPVKIHDSILHCINCSERDPIWYCLNDQQSFCEDCWQEAHDMAPNQAQEVNKTKFEHMAGHVKVDIGQRPKDFGTCKNHDDRKNEYYNNITSQAYCSMCVVDGLQKVDSSTQSKTNNQNSLIAIEKAYSNAFDDA